MDCVGGGVAVAKDNLSFVIILFPVKDIGYISVCGKKGGGGVGIYIVGIFAEITVKVAGNQP